MDLYVAIPATLALAWILYKVLPRNPAHSKAPPCLPTLPLVGSLPFLPGLQDIHKGLMEKGKRYGGVFAFYTGSRYTLVINGYDALQEALVKRASDFAGRWNIYAERTIWNVEERGLIFKPYGAEFKRNRLLTVGVMKQFGFGDRKIMETKVRSEIFYQHRMIREKGGAAFYPCPVLELSTLNLIYDLMFGERFEAGDETEIFLRQKVRDFVDSVNPLFDIFPLAVYLPMYRKFLASLPAKRDEWNQFFQEKIIECQKKRDTDDNNFVVQFIKKAGNEYDERELVYILRDFLSGGMETVATQLCWAVILLGNHHDVLVRLQAELDDVVPRERLPSIDDKSRLPYMEATILEIMRIRTVVPLGVLHLTLCDTELAGYKIPADTMVVINLWSADMDPIIWTEPEKFQPDRFLEQDKMTIKNREKLSNFSFGKRACPGEILAHQEMFLFLSALVQQFDILPPEGETSIRDETNFIEVLSPVQFEVRLVPRA